MVDERLRARVRGAVELDEHPLDVEKAALERVEEAPRLEVFRRRAPVRAVSAYKSGFPENLGWARVGVRGRTLRYPHP